MSMKLRKYASLLLLVTITMATIILYSCSRPSNISKAGNNDVKIHEDSILSMLFTNPKLILPFVDSLEAIHELPEYRANYYRAMACYRSGQELSAELYYRKALVGKELYDERPSIYYYACDQLSIILNIKGDQRSALDFATKGYALARQDNSLVGQEWGAILLHDIGYCQMQLGHHHEAEESFRNAFNRLKSLVEHDNNFTWLNDLARVSYNILDAYTTAGNYQEAVKWVPIAEEAIMQMIASPKCDKETAESYRGCLNTHKAIILYKTGHKEEAEKAYKEFLKSDYANSSIGLIDNAEYLDAIENWKDRSNLATRIDSLAKAWEMPPSMYYYKSYLMPNLKAHIKSGRTNEALKIALHITENIDSLDLFERKHNAEELAIIYETQEKEMKIAEQETQLRYQRAIVIVVAILVLMVFWIIFLYFRQRAARKLAEKNKELKQKNRELTVANAKAEESSRMKSDFIRQISHEIRTPLNILSGFTQVITEPDMKLSPRERMDISRRISENAERISTLVNRMLALSEVNSQTIIECKDQVDPLQIANQAVENARIEEATHITFSLQVEENAGNISLLTNLEQAVLALTQLLDNAQKFTKEGSVTLTIAATQHNDKPMVSFTVQDTGIGIPVYEADRVFHEFVQLNDFVDGTGIGLTIARNIARLLGGDIVLDTTCKKGARFIMYLPQTTL